MAYGKVGRPREDGERYPSGKLKRKPAPVADFESAPMSGAMWQRLVSNASDIFSDQGFATELTRLGAIGKLTPAEVATGIRIAGIYGRYEYYQDIKRTAASPYYVREFISASPDPEGVLEKATKDAAVLGDEPTEDDLEVRAQKASEEFKDLQAILLRSHRFDLEALCVENRHLDYAGFITVKEALAVAREFFQTKDEGGKKLSRRERRKILQKRKAAKKPDDTALTKEATAKPNSLRDAFLSMQRKLLPHLSEDQLNEIWTVLCTLKARQDFRREKSEGARRASP